MRAKRMGYTIEEVSKHNNFGQHLALFAAAPLLVPYPAYPWLLRLPCAWAGLGCHKDGLGSVRPVGCRPERVGKLQLPVRLGFDC